MPLTSDPQENIRELYHSAERPGSRMYKLAKKYGRGSEHFRAIVTAAAYAAARKKGYKG